MGKKALKIAIFFCILFISWRMAENILQFPKDPNWNLQGMESVRNKPDYYDVLISGTSMAITNVSVEELYLKYGIVGRSIGEPEQLAFLSYYSLEEALKYQKPKVVLFDVQSILYTDERQIDLINMNEDYAGHYTLDDIKNLKIKYEAVEQLRELHENSTYWDYFSTMYHNHGNWQNITNENFRVVQGSDIMLGSRNITSILENVSNDDYKYLEDNTFEKIEISELNKIYIKKMKELCKKNNCDLILIRGYGSKNWSWGEYNAISELSEQFGLDYLDLALCEKEIGFDWQTDSSDGKHHNVIGTKKWTDYLGDYLLSKYDFVDRRGDDTYQEFESEREGYENLIVAMNQKIELSSAINLNQYLDTLLNLEKEGNSIFISVSDEASYSLTDSAQSVLNAIGFKLKLIDKYRYSYYAVMDDGKVIEEACDNAGCETESELNNGTKYKIASGGYDSELTASITINGEEQIQGGRGINIVVYNKKCEQVISSVFFDTCGEENPQTTRIKNVDIIQYEKEINKWS